MDLFPYIATAFAAYFLGSIPTGYLIAKVQGIDIRTVGSGNIGATNAMRVLGKRAGIFVLIGDALKGWAAVVVGKFIWNVLIDPNFTDNLTAPINKDMIVCGDWARRESFALLAGIFAILGHNYTCWLKFKGGKGIATSCGVYLALAPLACVLAVSTWVITLFATRYVSIASIVAAIALPTAVALTKDSPVLTGVTIGIGALAVYKHKSNLKRLLNGTEHRFGAKDPPAPPAP